MAALVNINELGVDKRLKLAIYGVGVTLAAMLLMATMHAPSWSLTLLFVPFFFTANLAFQGLYKT